MTLSYNELFLVFWKIIRLAEIVRRIYLILNCHVAKCCRKVSMKYAVLKSQKKSELYKFTFFLYQSLLFKYLSCARKGVKSFKDIISLNFHGNAVRKLLYYSPKHSFYLPKFTLLGTGRSRIQSRFCLNPELTFNHYYMLCLMHILEEVSIIYCNTKNTF